MTNSRNMSHKAKETDSNLKSMIAALYKLTSLRAATADKYIYNLRLRQFTTISSSFFFGDGFVVEHKH